MVAKAATIRLARAGDAHVMSVMSRDLVEHGLGWRYSADRISRLMRETDILAIVACDGDDLQGFAILQFADLHAHLSLLCVRPDHQRKGVGSGLMAWLDQSVMVAGIASIHLELRTDNPEGELFYRRLGYTPTIDVPAYYDGRIAARRMVRVIRPPAVQE